MNSLHHKARKRFGQHFLVDQTIIQRIVHAIDPSPKDNMLEIGPGLGALTIAVLPLVKQLTAIELDRDVIPKLAKQCGHLGELTIIAQDALMANYSEFKKDARLLRIIGNLPYNISTPLLFRLFEFKDFISDMHFMLQKEVVDRLTAAVDTEHYSRLSVIAQYQCQAEFLFEVPPHAFSPPPKVDSAIIRLKPIAEPFNAAKDFNLFSEIVRLAFMHRRKTLKNNLKGLLTIIDFEKLAITNNARAQELSVQQFVAIANYLFDK